MPKLAKSLYTTYIAGTPGSPGSPGIPASPGYWRNVCTTSPGSCTTTLSPVYGTCTGGLAVGTNSCVVDYISQTVCTDAKTTCTPVYVPPSAGVPAVPAIAPTPGQLIQNFNEGWNASAQSYVGLLPGKAVVFKVGNGSRGVLTGFAPEPWSPRVSTLGFGVMFYDGRANVYENNVMKEALGYFYNGQEFLIGRTLDNYVVYMNRTTGQAVARRSYPAASTVPVHFFAMQYRGGDIVLT
jgi:hypothetical protein